MTKQSREENQAKHQRRWQAHLDAMVKSGLSRSEYCRQQNLSYHAMTYWQRKLSRPSNRTNLVPVTLPPAFIRHGGQHNEAELRIILPGNLSIAVGDNFSPITLSRVLTVLENR